MIERKLMERVKFNGKKLRLYWMYVLVTVLGTGVFFVVELAVLVPNCIDNLRATPPSFILRLKVMNSLILPPPLSTLQFTFI